MEAPRDPRISSECERCLELHQTETGAFACPSKIEESKRWDEPCLTGNMIQTLIKFGYSNDQRVRKAIDWLPKDQLEDGGRNCDYPEKKVKHSSFMSTIEPLWAYSEIPRQKWSRKMKQSIEDGPSFSSCTTYTSQTTIIGRKPIPSSTNSTFQCTTLKSYSET
jgi:hypothetical protein